MTAFVPSDLPANIDTVEEVAAWACSALAEINPTVEVATSPGQLEPVATVQTFAYASQQTNPQRLICVLYLPLNQDWRSAGKVYSGGVAEISGGALPPAFKVA